MSPINIYQVYYKPEQKLKLQSYFIPYDNTPANDPVWCEYGVIDTLYCQKKMNAGITGVVSWKYSDITGHSSQSVINEIRKTPADCYILYPIHYEGTKNIWRQGNEAHPGMLRVAETMFNKLGYSNTIASLDQPCNEFLLRNYFAANKGFWDAYMGFATRFEKYLRDEIPPAHKKILNSNQTKIGSSPVMHPYIMERLFSTFLAFCRLGILPYKWDIHTIPKASKIQPDYQAFKDIVVTRL